MRFMAVIDKKISRKKLMIESFDVVIKTKISIKYLFSINFEELVKNEYGY